MNWWKKSWLDDPKSYVATMGVAGLDWSIAKQLADEFNVANNSNAVYHPQKYMSFFKKFRTEKERYNAINSLKSLRDALPEYAFVIEQIHIEGGEIDELLTPELRSAKRKSNVLV